MSRADPFTVRVPWWARVVGAVRRWGHERRETARLNRERVTPVYKCTVVGKGFWKGIIYLTPR